MYKKLRYGLLTLLAFVGLTASAQGVVFDFDNDYATLFPSLGLSDGNGSDEGDIYKDVTSTAIEGFTITVSAKEEEAEYPNRLWNGTNHLRMYSGTLTISGSESIENIEFTWGKGNISTNTGDLKGNVWTGSAKEVVFHVVGSTQISEIVINGNAEAPEETEEDLNHGTADDPISVSEAIYAAEVVGKSESKEDFYVFGTISSIAADKNNGTPYTYSYKGNATYFIKDNSGNEFEIYQGKYFSGVSWEEGMPDIEEGDVVVVCGKIMNYGGHTPEFASGKSHLVLLNGEGYEDPTPVEPTIQNISVADFLEEPVSNNTWYRLTGMIKNLKDGDKYGNFDLEDATGSVYVYGVLSEKGGDKKLFQELVEQYGIQNGGYITIIGNRGYYAGKDQIQVANAYFEDYEAGVDPETYEVKVAEALEAAGALDEGETSFDFYQVTGIVVDDPEFERNPDKDNALYGNVNLNIADTKAGETLAIYRAMSLDNEPFTEDDLDLFAKGDIVTFKGKLKKFVKDDVTTLELVDGYLVSVTSAPEAVSVELPESGLGTFCSAYPIIIDDQNVYIVKEILKDDAGEDYKATVEKIESGTVLAAGVGMIVQGSGTVIFEVSDEDGIEPEGNLLVGTLKPTEVELFTVYGLSDGAFCLCEGGTFPAEKAYLPLPLVETGAKISIDFGGMTTGISEVKAQNENSEIYTIDGIRVKNAQQKGIYIINGKKVVK